MELFKVTVNVTYDEDDYEEYTSDKTPEEIKTAASDGKAVIALVVYRYGVVPYYYMGVHNISGFGNLPSFNNFEVTSSALKVQELIIKDNKSASITSVTK